MSYIIATGTALPGPAVPISDVLKAGGSWLRDHPTEAKLFERFVTASKTSDRHLIVSAQEVVELGGFAQRGEIFERCAPALGAEALQRSLQGVGKSVTDLGMHFFTSCSVPSIPSIDGAFLQSLGAPSTLRRVPLFQLGCAGGVSGLALAAEAAQNHDFVALTAVELCSLVFQKSDFTPAQLVGSAIFADGAASVLLARRSPNKPALRVIASRSYLIPETRHLMGYDLWDDGLHLRLDKALPQVLLREAPPQVEALLAEQKLSRENISHWLFHPGGVKILEALEQEFARPGTTAHWSRDILLSIGNLSSATVLFVLDSFLKAGVAKVGEYVLLLGVGPGLTLEMVLMQWSEGNE